MKEDKEGIVIILILMTISAIIISMIYKSIAGIEKSYEYGKNGEIHKSNKCYLKNDVTYCEKDNIVIMVDYYYTIK